MVYVSDVLCAQGVYFAGIAKPGQLLAVPVVAESARACSYNSVHVGTEHMLNLAVNVLVVKFWLLAN